MAKLNGVTLVSERISYNGVEYVKSDEKAAVGDIVRHDDSGYSFLPKGTFYEVVKIDTDGEPQIIDEEGDDIDVDEDFTLYKRVEASSVSPVKFEERASAAVGDKIRVVNALGTLGKYENGDEFIAKSVRSDGAVSVSEHDRPIALNEYEIIPQPQPTYTEVKRKANVGERIRIVDIRDHSVYGMYKNGDEFIVAGIEYSCGDVKVEAVICDRNPTGIIFIREYVVLEPVTSAKQATTPVDSRLKVGEYAKVIGGDNYQTKIGDIVVIRSIDTDGTGDYRVNDLDGEELRGHKKARNVIRATDGEVAEAKRKNVKVGDYVKLTEYQSGAPAGTSVKVVAVSDGGRMVTYEWDRHSRLLSTKFEPITPVEAEQARKEAAQKAEQAALEAKWSAIGRKVNEFKEGDLVRVLGTLGSSMKIGEVTTVVSPDGTDSPSVRHRDGGTRYATVELIASVESLFTR
jgi:uncharacterized protein (UPF0179 family)